MVEVIGFIVVAVLSVLILWQIADLIISIRNGNDDWR